MKCIQYVNSQCSKSAIASSLKAAALALLLAVPLAGCEESKPAADTQAAAEAKKEEAMPEAKKEEGKQAKVEVKTEEVTYTAGDATLKGFLAYDSNQKQPGPGVLVVHEWWGHNDFARDRAKELASMGYTALAVDMYGDGKQAEHPDDAKKFSSEVMGNMPVATERFEAAHKLLAEHSSTDPEKISAIGYCFGGGVVLQMARQGADLDGVASFHGMLGTKTPAKKGEVKAKVLVLHGEADPFVPEEQVKAFKKEMAEAGVDLKFVSYPEAKHAFTVPGVDEKGKKFDLPLAYNEEAAEKSWDELKNFLSSLYSKS